MERNLPADSNEIAMSVGFTSRRREQQGQGNCADSTSETDVLERLEQIEFSIVEANQASRDVTGLLTERLADFTRAVASNERVEALLASLNARLDAMTGSGSDKCLAPEGPVGQPMWQPDEINERFDSIDASVIDIQSKIVQLTDRLDSTAQEASAELATRSSSLVEALKTLKPTDPTELTTLLEAQVRQISAVVAAESETLQNALLGQMNSSRDHQKTETTSITADFELSMRSALSAAMAGVQERACETVVTEVEARISSGAQFRELNNKIDALRSRPDPVLDLGPQRRSLAQFSTVLSQVVSKFDEFEERISQRFDVPIEPEPDNEALVEKIDQLIARLEAEPEPGNKDTDNVSAGIAELCTAVNALTDKVDARSHTPSEVTAPSLMSHQKSLVRFQTANRVTLDRLTTIVDAFSSRFQTLEEQLLSIRSDLAVDVMESTPETSQEIFGPLQELALANRILASSCAPSEKVLAAHQDFLSDMRITVAESLALCLQDAHTLKSQASEN